MNRRKLGTSRRNKGRQRVKDPETQLDVESREDVQDEARGSKCPEAHVSAAKQPKVEEVGQESECGMAAPQDDFLVSIATDDQTDGDKTGILCSEDILITRDVNTPPFKDETKLEDTRRTDALQSEIFNQNLDDHLPEVTRLRASDQQMIEQAQDVNLCSVAESNSSKLVDSGLFRQDGRLQGNFSVCESHVDTSITPQIISDNTLRENIAVNDRIKREAFSLQKEELPASKDSKFLIPEVGDAQCSDEVKENVYSQNNMTQLQSEHQSENSAENPLQDRKENHSYSENKEFESDAQYMFLVKSTAFKNDALTTAQETSFGQTEDNRQIVESVLIERVLSETKRNSSSVPTVDSDLMAPAESQLQDSYLTTGEGAESDFSFNVKKKKMGSSRRNKEKRHAKELEQVTFENTLTNTPLETMVFSKIKGPEEEELSVDTGDDTIMSLSQGSSVSLSLVPPSISSEDPDNSQSLIMKSENHQKGQEETTPLAFFDVVENSDVSQHEVDQSSTLHSEDTVSSHSEDVSWKLQDQAELSELCETSPDDFTTKQKEHATEGNITECQPLKNENYDLYDTNYLQISDLEKQNSAPGQVQKIKNEMADDLKLTTDQILHQKKHPALFESQPKEASGNVDEQPMEGSNQASYSNGNRKKMGSSRKIVGKQQDKDSKEDVKEKSSCKITTQMLDKEAMAKIYPVNEEGLTPEGNIPQHQDKSETEFPEKTWEETSEYQSDTFKSESGIHQTKEVVVPYLEDDERQVQEELQSQVLEPQQMDYVVDGQVGEDKVCLEDPKNNSANPHSQDNSLSTDKQTDAGFVFTGSKKKLSSSRKNKGRQQGKEPTNEVFDHTRDDQIWETASMLMKEEPTQDNEPRIPETDLQDFNVKYEHLQENLNERWPESENKEVSQQAVEEFDTLRNENTKDTVAGDAQREVGGVEIYPTKMEKSLHAEHLSKTVLYDVLENVQKISESLTNSEISELHLKRVDGSSSKQENYSEAKDEKNQDSGLCYINTSEVKDLKTKEAVSNDIEEFKGKVESDLQLTQSLTSEQMFHEEKRGFSSEENKAVPTKLMVEIDSFDSKPQEMTDNVDEQIESSGNKRKNEFSQSSEGRKQAEKCDDVKEKSKGVLSLETTHVSSETKTANQEELRQDVERDVSSVSNDNSVFTAGHSSEIQGFSPSTYPENDLVSSTSENVYLTKYQEESEIDNNRVSFEKSEGKALVDAFETLQSQTYNSPQDSDNTIKPAQNYTDPPIDTQQSQQMDNWSEIAAHDIRYQDTILEDTIDQAEIISSIHSELTVKSDDGSDTKQELLPENQQYLCFTTKGNVEALVPTKTDDCLCDSKETLIDSVVEVNTALGQMDQSLVQGSEHNPADVKVQDSSLSTDKQTDVGFSYSGGRKKLGSSRRNKQRKGVKESTQEALENTATEEAINTSTVLLDIKATKQEELSKDTADEVTLSASHDFPTIPAPSSEDQSSVETKGPDRHPKTLIVECENLQEDTYKINSYVLAQDEEKLVDLSLSKYKALHCEDARHVLKDAMMKNREEEDYSTTVEHSLQMTHSSETASDNTTKDVDIMYGSLTDQGEMPPITVKSAEGFIAKEEEHYEKEITSEMLDNKNEEMVQHDKKTKADQIFHQDKESLSIEKEESKPFFSNIQPETLSLYPQPEETSKSVDEHFNTDLSNNMSRQKEGSSLKSKANQQVRESQDEVNENTWVDENPKTTQILDAKTVSEEEQRLDVEQNDNTILSMFPPGDSSEVQSTMQDIYTDPKSLIEEDNLEKPDKSERYNVDLSNKSQENSSLDKTDFLEIKDENLWKNQIRGPKHSETAIKQTPEHEDPLTDISGSPQKEGAQGVPHCRETNLKDIEQVKIMQSDFEVKSNDGSDTKQELPLQDQCFKTEPNVETLDQTNKDYHLHDSKEASVSSLVEEITPLSQTKEGGSLAQSPTDPKLQDSSLSTDNQTDVGFSGIRRKLGSSRRNKGRRDVKESTQETLKNTLNDDSLQTTVLLETSGAEQEDLSEDIEHKIILSLSQDLSLIPSHIIPSEDSSYVLKKDPTTDLQLLMFKNENCGDGSETRSEPGIIDKPINVPQLEEGQSDIVHCKVTKDIRSDDAFREEEDFQVHSTEMQDTLQTKCYLETVAENKGIIPEKLTGPAEMSALTVKVTDGSAIEEDVYHRKDNYPEALDVKNGESDLYDLNMQQITDFGEGDSALDDQMEGQSSMSPDIDPKCFIKEINLESQNKSETDHVVLSLQSGDDSLLDKSDSLESEDKTFCSKEVIGPEHESSVLFNPSLVQSLEVQSSMQDIYPKNDQENLIIGGAIIFKDLDKSETCNVEFPGQSWETSEHHSDSLQGKSGILHHKNPDDANGQGQEHEVLQTQVQEPQQMDYVVEGEGKVCLEDAKANSANPQHQENSLSTDKQTTAGFGLTGSRKKLGSSRRKKGRQTGIEPTEERSESKRFNETLEIPTMQLETGTAEQEELKGDTKHNIMSVSQDDISTGSIPPNISFENQSSVLEKYPEKEVQSLILKSESIQEDLDERKSNVFAQDGAKPADVSIDESDTFYKRDPSNTLSENGNEMLEADSTQIQESIQTYSYNTITGDANENLEITSGNPTDQAELSEQKINIVDNTEIKEESHPSEEINSDVYGLNNEETTQSDVKPNTDEIFQQEQKYLLCETREKTLGLSNFPSENILLNPQPQELSENVDEQTKADLHSSGSRRKLGSSRRNKGRIKAKDSAAVTMNAVEMNASVYEKTEKVAQGQEKSMETVQDKVQEKHSSQTKNVNIGTFTCTTGIQPSPTVDCKVIDTSREPPKPHSTDHDKCRELCLQDGNFMESFLLSESHACPPTTERYAEKSKSCVPAEPETRDVGTFEKVLEWNTMPAQNQDMSQTIEKEKPGNPDDYSRNMFEHTEAKVSDEDNEILKPNEFLQSNDLCAPPEKDIEKARSMYHAPIDYSIEQGAVSSPQEMCSADGEKDRHTAAEMNYFIDMDSKEQKEQAKDEQMQETHQISLEIDESHVQTQPSDKEVESFRKTQQSDKDATLDSEPQDSYQSLKDDIHSGPKAAAHKRKLGSSRRYKGQRNGQNTEQNQETKNEVQENTGDEETAQMLAGQEEEIEKEIQSENVATIRSTVTEKLLEENIVSSHDVLGDSTRGTSGFHPNSNQVSPVKSNEERKDEDVKRTHENNDSSQLTGHDTNKMGLMQSTQASVGRGGLDMQSTLFHNGIISPKAESVQVINHEEALQRQNREALSCGKDPPGTEFHLQHTNKDTETVGFVTTEDCSSEVESSMDVHDLKQDEKGEKCMYEAQQKNTSNEFISASQEPAVDASNKEGISAKINAPNSQGENPHLALKQKKRKLGSSRRTQVNRKQEGETHTSDETEKGDFSAKTEVMNLGELEDEGELQLKVGVLQGEDVQPQQEALMQQETTETEIRDSLQTSNVNTSFSSEKSATIDLIIETPKPDDFTRTEIQMTPEFVERNKYVLNQPMTSNTDTQWGSPEVLCDPSQNKQGDEQSPQNMKVKRIQDIQEQFPSRMNEGIHTQNPGIRDTSQDLTPTNRRRKMGSTRKNLGIQTKQEILEPKNESAGIVTSSRDITVSSDPGKKETQPQLHTGQIDDNSHQETKKETLEISQFGESLLRALAEETAEENAISQKQTAETEQEQSPSRLSSSPPTSDSASGGRRKKFGSNRKSGLQQRKPERNAEHEDEARGITEEGAHKAAEREESSDLTKISKVDENEGFSKPARNKAAGTLLHDKIHLNEETGTQLSFGTSNTDKSDCYNVVMVGESCVGKTSFMKRAQNGKFSLDLPASVGLDSCKWTVVVDGKPVVLQLWDTAGQERFHSITRQVFHKAHAFLLMYDITSSQSFSAVSYWANSIQEAAAEDVTVLLVGNKCEHAKRQVKTDQGDILAKEYNFEFIECSAATGENVIEALETVARMLSHRADLLREEVTVLHKEPAKRRSKCC